MPEIPEKWSLHDTPKTSYKKALGNWPKRRVNDYNLFNLDPEPKDVDHPWGRGDDDSIYDCWWLKSNTRE